MKTKWMLGLWLALSVGVFGQTLNRPAQASIKQAAFAAFSAEDYTGGIAQLNRLIRRDPRAAPEPLQVAAYISEQSFWFNNSDERAKAKNLALLALAQLNVTRSTWPANDRAQAALLEAELQERVLHNIEAAKSGYQQVLTADPNQKRASDALLRLNATEAKSTGNTLLGNRPNG